MECEEIKLKLMAKMDGELNLQEQNELQRAIDGCSNCTCWKEWQEFMNTEKKLSNFKFIEPEEQAWKGYWSNIYNRIERQISFVFLGIGSIFLLGYKFYQLFYEFFYNPEISIIIRTGVFLLITGGIILTVSLIRERLTLRKFDEFERIEK